MGAGNPAPLWLQCCNEESAHNRGLSMSTNLLPSAAVPDEVRTRPDNRSRAVWVFLDVEQTPTILKI